MLKHLLGHKTSRKIIVFESDDWGSFRFKNKAIRDAFMPQPQPGQWMHYNDCFESYEDVQALEDTLKSVADKNNKSAKFTFLMNPANPDFKKIEEENFKTYHYETWIETLSKRADGKQLLQWYQNALLQNWLEVGFHGREHLNVAAWMNALQKKDKSALEGFNNRIWGHAKLMNKDKKLSYRSTFLIENKTELNALKANIKEGIAVLKETFGQPVTYFLPPDGPYHLSLNKSLVENGIKYIGLARLHNNPLEDKKLQTKFFWLGKKTKEGLKVITRNVMFEPSSPQSSNWVNFALHQVEEAFKYKNPAIISTHRANYVSGLNPQNRENALAQLHTLLKKIVTKWPEVEFMTSSQLGDELLSTH